MTRHASWAVLVALAIGIAASLLTEAQCRADRVSLLTTILSNLSSMDLRFRGWTWLPTLLLCIALMGIRAPRAVAVLFIAAIAVAALWLYCLVNVLTVAKACEGLGYAFFYVPAYQLAISLVAIVVALFINARTRADMA